MDKIRQKFGYIKISTKFKGSFQRSKIWRYEEYIKLCLIGIQEADQRDVMFTKFTKKIRGLQDVSLLTELVRGGLYICLDSESKFCDPLYWWTKIHNPCLKAQNLDPPPLRIHQINGIVCNPWGGGYFISLFVFVKKKSNIVSYIHMGDPCFSTLLLENYQEVSRWTFNNLFFNWICIFLWKSVY